MGPLFLTSLWLAVSTNVDNFGVGVAYGIKRIRIGAAANLLIACCNCSATYLSMKAGDTLAEVVPATICNTVGGMTIVIVGLWALLNTFAFGGSDSEKNPEGAPQEVVQLEYLSQHPEVLDTDGTGHINVREALPLAFALSISNLATGMGARLAGLDVDFLVLLMFAFSLLGIIVGYYFGRLFSLALPKRWPGVLSGVLLIAFGFYGLLSARVN
jgi:putative sporulation protein YtaF